jgi:hypothetical protein
MGLGNESAPLDWPFDRRRNHLHGGTMLLTLLLRMVALIAFFFVTAPVAAAMLERAAFLTGVKPMEGINPCELSGRYDPETRGLS